MKEMLTQLLIAVITVGVPIITAYLVKLINKAAENAAADTDDIKAKSYIEEIAKAITDAVSATSQTYVDALKQTGKFTKEAQAEAAQKALTVCLATISPAAQTFIESAYGDLTDYLSTKIEAEVRKQKIEAPATLALPVMESTTDTTAVAASTAAATAASYLQTAINQLDAEAKATEN
jgi:hypothetical protein